MIIRHAKSSWEHPELMDIQRPLAERGIQTAPRMAELLKQLIPTPDLFIVSPAIRALQTMYFFQEKFSISQENIIVEPTLYYGTAQSIIEMVREIPESKKTVLLFGHNPLLEMVAQMLTGKNQIELPTCACVWFQIPEQSSWNSLKEGGVTKYQSFIPKKCLA